MTERVTVIESESEALVIETPGGAEVFDRRDADVVVVQEGVQGPPGPPGSAASAHLQLAAGAPLGGHRAVRSSGGRAVYADCRQAAHAQTVLGVTVGAVSAGELATVQQTGLMDEPSWSWLPDAPVFVGEDGALVQGAPVSGFCLRVGVALTPTRICIGQHMPVVLSG